MDGTRGQTGCSPLPLTPIFSCQALRRPKQPRHPPDSTLNISLPNFADYFLPPAHTTYKLRIPARAGKPAALPAQDRRKPECCREKVNRSKKPFSTLYQ